MIQKAKALSKQNKPNATLPRPDALISLCMDLTEALEKAQAQVQKLERENNTLARERDVLSHQGKRLNRSSSGYGKTSSDEEQLLIRERLAILESERNRYEVLFQQAPEAYLITDPDGNIREVNQVAAELLNVSPNALTGKALINFISEHERHLFASLFPRVRHIQDFEICIQPRGKSSVDVSLALNTVYDKEGQPTAGHWQLRDITERKHALAALDASEHRFRTVFDQAMLGILLIDLEGHIARANLALQSMLGFSETELFGRDLTEQILSEDHPLATRVFDSMASGQRDQEQVELRCKHRDSSLVWVNTHLSLLRDEKNAPQFIIALVENITAEKQAGAELAEVRTRLLESAEIERLRLAQELHDGPMQDLYGAVFRLANFLTQTEDSQMQANLQEAQGILKGVAGTLREVVGELRPPTLANLGLERAIRSHAEALQEMQPNIHIQLQLTRDEQRLPANIRLAFFRIYQQCIANILRHAQATQVMVDFHYNDDEVTLDIWDNGCGFNLPDKWVDLLRQGHFGLAGIAERVQGLGGQLKIETQPGGGTLVHVAAPIG